MPRGANDLQSFIRLLESERELTRIATPTSPILEIAHRADAESKRPAPNLPSAAAQRNDPRFAHLGGSALLFENVHGSKMPVLINAIGSYRRMELALGCTDAAGFDGIGAKIGALLKPEPPKSLKDAIAAARRYAPLLRIAPKGVGSGVCQEVVRTGGAVDLTELPLLRCWPHDGDLAAVGYPADANDGVAAADLTADPDSVGRYITFAGIHTIHADDAGEPKPASHNVGMYRVQLVGRKTLAMHWHLHHDGASHWRSWRKLGKPMPVAIVLGGDSVLPMAAIAPLPPGINELLMAGFLRGSGVRVCKGVTVPLRVPANAEIVIEGFVRPDAGGPGFDPRDPSHGALGPGAFFEGPFGDHTGFYSLPDRYPLVEVTAITTRRSPVFPATVVGPPPQEDYPMGKAVERLFLPPLKTLIHDIEEYNLPLFGCFHNCVVAQIKKAYALQARRVMHAVWGAGQMAWTKFVIVVDSHTDPHDTAAVLRAVATRFDPVRSLERVSGPLDILDHAAPGLGAGCKAGFDATAPMPGETCATGAQAPHDAQPLDDDALKSLLVAVRGADSRVVDAAVPDVLGRGWLFVRATPPDSIAGADASLTANTELVASLLLLCAEHSGPRLCVLLGPDAPDDLADFDRVLFLWCAHTDPGRDAVVAHGRLGFDATPKLPGGARSGRPTRDWPVLLPGAPIPT